MLHITPWERVALQLLANGATTNEMAGRFGVSECQIEAHLTSLSARMGAASRTEAIAAALRRGLLNSDDRSHEVTKGDAGSFEGDRLSVQADAD